jgi:uncharacterized protein (TIRG00374 family)
LIFKIIFCTLCLCPGRFIGFLTGNLQVVAIFPPFAFMTKRSFPAGYFFWLGIAVLLVWLSLQMLAPGAAGKERWDALLEAWRKADKGWLWLMALLAMLSHLIRAERWRMLLQAAGQQVNVYHAFLSLMVGYLVNLAVPRGGEVWRCLNLYKLNRCPVDQSLGTVVAERALDLLCFVLVVVVAFLLEFSRLTAFVRSLPVQFPALPGARVWLTAGGALLILALAGWMIRRRFPSIGEGWQRFRRGFSSGLKAALHVKPGGLFLFYTATIWLLYFFMSYAVLKAFPETAALEYRAVLNMFAIGSLAMVLPLPGGTGSYHTLVPAGLSFLYHLPLADAVAFTFIFHAWQTLIMIAGGIPSLLATTLRKERISAENELTLKP